MPPLTVRCSNIPKNFLAYAAEPATIAFSILSASMRARMRSAFSNHGARIPFSESLVLRMHDSLQWICRHTGVIALAYCRSTRVTRAPLVFWNASTHAPLGATNSRSAVKGIAIRSSIVVSAKRIIVMPWPAPR